MPNDIELTSCQPPLTYPAPRVLDLLALRNRPARYGEPFGDGVLAAERAVGLADGRAARAKMLENPPI
jgi:hypothetical protein